MNTRIHTAIVSLGAAVLAFSASVGFADTVVYDGVTYTILDADATPITVEVGTGEPWEYNSKGSVSTYYPAIDTNTEFPVTIPETFTLDGTEYTVTKVGHSAFYKCKALTGVNLPDTVTSIGTYAFGYCTALTSFEFSENIASIGQYAFSNSGLKEIAIPDGFTAVNKRMFQGCKSLVKVTLPDSVARLMDGAFRDCTALGEITIGPKFYTTNSDYVQVSRCTSLTNVVFQEGANAVSSQMFIDSKNLRRVVLPSTIALVNSGAFSGDPVVEATIPQCVVSAGVTNVFTSAAESLEDLTLVGVTEIPAGAFDGLVNLKRLYIPEGVKELPDGVFSSCADSLEELVMMGVTNMTAGAFSGLVNLRTLYIPDSVASVDEEIFADMTRLEDLRLPSGISGLTSTSFSHCDALWAKWYATLISPSYDLAASPGDRKVASVEISGDFALDEFVLSDGKVYDAVIMVENVSDESATLSLPSGYRYVAAAGKKPLVIPAASLNLITITRMSDDTFLVSRQKLSELD